MEIPSFIERGKFFIVSEEYGQIECPKFDSFTGDAYWFKDQDGFSREFKTADYGKTWHAYQIEEEKTEDDSAVKVQSWFKNHSTPPTKVYTHTVLPQYIILSTPPISKKEFSNCTNNRDYHVTAISYLERLLRGGKRRSRLLCSTMLCECLIKVRLRILIIMQPGGRPFYILME